MTDSEKITQAFKVLRQKGWFARKNFWCCQTCGCAAVPNEYKNKFVFYHNQDNASIKKAHSSRTHWFDRQDYDVNSGDIMSHGLYMTHGEGGDGKEICEALLNAGLNVSWDETNNTRILVEHNPNEGRGVYTKLESRQCKIA